MMQTLRQWCFSVCATAVCCGIVQILIPRSGLERILKMTVSVFFLTSLITPLLLGIQGGNLSLDWELSREQVEQQLQSRGESLESELERRFARDASGQLEQIVSEALVQMGINSSEISIKVNTNEEGSISISEVELQLDEQYESRHDEIRSQLEEILGVRVLIGYETGG